MTRLAALREAAGLTRRQTARRLGISAVYLGELERAGISALTLPMARRMGRLYGISLDELRGAVNQRQAKQLGRIS